MLRKSAVFVVVCLCSTLSMAQIPGVCGQASAQNKVGCTLATTYNTPGWNPGALPIYQNGKPDQGNGTDKGSFDFTSSPTYLAATLGTELTTLPLTAPGSGFVFQLDKASGLEVRYTQSLGPILAERGETIGRHKLFVAFAYQYFKFSTEDGISNRGLHNVLQHVVDNPSKQEDSDVITTNDAIDLKIHQFTAFATFGLTDRIDISAVIPILNVRLGAYSNTTIHNLFQPNNIDHAFCISPTLLNQCNTMSFSNFRQASGIGDVLFRGKVRVWNGEHTKLAVGADLRVPTGDELNYRGSGTYGVRPFAAISYNRKRIAPHGNIGFEVNGNSILAGDFGSNTKAHLPNEITYSVGTDFGITSRFTVAADWLGERIINGFRVSQSSCSQTAASNPTGQPYNICVPGASGSPTFAQSLPYRASYNMNDFSFGAKLSPAKNLLVTFNAIVKLDDPGLRSKVVPLVSVGYAF